MKKIDVAQLITILANIGVVAGIAILALEVHQNNELLRAQARAARLETVQANFLRIIENPHLAEALNYPVTTAFYFYVVNGWQFSFQEYQAGLLELEALPLNGWRGWVLGFPRMQEFWNGAQQTFMPDFRTFMEEEVIQGANN